MTEVLTEKKVEEVKKKAKLSVQERLLRIYKEEKFYKERFTRAKFKEVADVNIDKELLDKKDEKEGVVAKKNLISDLKGVYNG